ncbi:MAG: GNAT family N-acetyltransferase [Anaerolineae bacterium]|nr:GNAT family N-acetyltransferase [Anaerolineae bacterium]
MQHRKMGSLPERNDTIETINITNAETDAHGAKKENTFIALNQDGGYLGSLRIYPFYDEDIEPEHPHNLYLHLHSPEGQEMSPAARDPLLAQALRRAKEIKREAQQTKTRVYACLLKQQQEEIAYFLRRGFTHDEEMYILERYAAEAPRPADAPQGTAIQVWSMATPADQHRFIEVHRTVFPRHPYSTESLRELQSLPDWRNYTAFDEDEIVGNIMVYVQRDGAGIGYIEDLFVLKPWRQRGLGRCLVTTALVYFHSIGVDRVRLEVWSANRPALHLCGALGFSAIDETEIAVGRYV